MPAYCFFYTFAQRQKAKYTNEKGKNDRFLNKDILDERQDPDVLKEQYDDIGHTIGLKVTQYVKKPFFTATKFEYIW